MTTTLGAARAVWRWIAGASVPNSETRMHTVTNIMPLERRPGQPPVGRTDEPAPVELPENLDAREGQVIDGVLNAFAGEAELMAQFGARALDTEDIGQWRARRDQLVSVLAALKADRPRRKTLREEALTRGALLAADNAFREFDLRIERADILVRRIDARLAAGSGG